MPQKAGPFFFAGVHSRLLQARQILRNTCSTNPRPILISLTKASEVELILSKRFSISASDRLRIKPDISPEEKATESLLLKEQRNLIASGIDKQFIRIRRNHIYISHSQHGEVTNGVFQLTGPSSKQANTNPVTQDTQNTTSNVPPSTSCESNSTSPVLEETRANQ